MTVALACAGSVALVSVVTYLLLLVIGRVIAGAKPRGR